MPDGMLLRLRDLFELDRLAKDETDRLVDELHEDVDRSTLRVDCRSGSCDVRLQERIWWTWSDKRVWSLKAGENVRATEMVDSSFFDGDHRLSVVATSDRTAVHVDFSSRSFG